MDRPAADSREMPAAITATAITTIATIAVITIIITAAAIVTAAIITADYRAERLYPVGIYGLWGEPVETFYPTVYSLLFRYTE